MDESGGEEGLRRAFTFNLSTRALTVGMYSVSVVLDDGASYALHVSFRLNTGGRAPRIGPSRPSSGDEGRAARRSSLRLGEHSMRVGEEQAPGARGRSRPRRACRRSAPTIWLTHMKTTIDIADPLLKRAKRLAARRGTTLRVVVEEALREKLATESELGAPSQGVDTHTVRGRGLQAGLSWEDVRTLRDLAYEGRGT